MLCDLFCDCEFISSACFWCRCEIPVKMILQMDCADSQVTFLNLVLFEGLSKRWEKPTGEQEVAIDIQKLCKMGKKIYTNSS